MADEISRVLRNQVELDKDINGRQQYEGLKDFQNTKRKWRNFAKTHAGDLGRYYQKRPAGMKRTAYGAKKIALNKASWENAIKNLSAPQLQYLKTKGGKAFRAKFLNQLKRSSMTERQAFIQLLRNHVNGKKNAEIHKQRFQDFIKSVPTEVAVLYFHDMHTSPNLQKRLGFTPTEYYSTKTQSFQPLRKDWEPTPQGGWDDQSEALGLYDSIQPYRYNFLHDRDYMPKNAVARPVAPYVSFYDKQANEMRARADQHKRLELARMGLLDESQIDFSGVTRNAQGYPKFSGPKIRGDDSMGQEMVEYDARDNNPRLMLKSDKELAEREAERSIVPFAGSRHAPGSGYDTEDDEPNIYY